MRRDAFSVGSCVGVEVDRGASHGPAVRQDLPHDNSLFGSSQRVRVGKSVTPARKLIEFYRPDYVLGQRQSHVKIIPRRGDGHGITDATAYNVKNQPRRRLTFGLVQPRSHLRQKLSFLGRGRSLRGKLVDVGGPFRLGLLAFSSRLSRKVGVVVDESPQNLPLRIGERGFGQKLRHGRSLSFKAPRALDLVREFADIFPLRHYLGRNAYLQKAERIAERNEALPRPTLERPPRGDVEIKAVLAVGVTLRFRLAKGGLRRGESQR